MTPEEARSFIEGHQTPNGGYTRQQLAQWNIPWPPPRGWKERLITQLTRGTA